MTEAACESCGDKGGRRYKTLLLHRDGAGFFARCACGWVTDPPTFDPSNHERRGNEHASGCVEDAWFIEYGRCADCGKRRKRAA